MSLSSTEREINNVLLRWWKHLPQSPITILKRLRLSQDNKFSLSLITYTGSGQIGMCMYRVSRGQVWGLKIWLPALSWKLS